MLGPNGSGKTTLIRILSTLLAPDTGRAVGGRMRIVKDAATLRTKIGLAGQYAAVDELLTGRENLELVGLWYHLPKSEYRRLAQEILERLDLTEAANRRTDGYSGGMRRRLDIGASLLARPPVLFLDEPTTGLDPRILHPVGVHRGAGRRGTTVLLTTQYMEEAGSPCPQHRRAGPWTRSSPGGRHSSSRNRSVVTGSRPESRTQPTWS